MSIDDPAVAVKWLGAILAIFSLPFAWIHSRQNRADVAIVSMLESVARIEVHQEHIRKDIAILMSKQSNRRDEFKGN